MSNRITTTIIRRSLVAVIFALVMCNTLHSVNSLSFKPAPIFSMKGINGDSSASTVIDPPEKINGEGINDISQAGTVSELSDWSMTAGDTALRQVQFLASKVAESTETAVETTRGETMLESVKTRLRVGSKRSSTGVFNNAEYNDYTEKQPTSQQQQSMPNSRRSRPQVSSNSKRDEQVWAALSNLELDMQLLDNLAGQKPQLSALELVMLSASVAAASSSPWIMGGKLTEVLPPTAAACKYFIFSDHTAKIAKRGFLLTSVFAFSLKHIHLIIIFCLSLSLSQHFYRFRIDDLWYVLSRRIAVLC